MCPPFENSAAAACPSHAPSGEYSLEERALLLNLAHEAIASAIEQREISLIPPSPHLAERRGVFTSLYRLGELRGCVGYVLPVSSLYQAVAETARSAAFDDARFPPIRRDELPGLRVSLSVISPLRPIQAEEIEIGRHGLMIKSADRRGLLLPQVAVEQGWDRIQFLEHTCRKAELTPDAWQHGAKIEAFTAEVFGE